MLARLRTTFLYLLCLGSLASCAGTRHLRYVEAGEATSVPRYIALEEEQSIATVHFPRGLYSLDLEDDGGYYYRAPGSVIKHSFAGFDRYDGGIFVAKQSRRIRGYLVWAGGRTQIGNLSGAKYAFRD